MKQLSSFDITKFICALLVVSLHCKPITQGSFFLESLARNAVPMFYVISSYLFFSKERKHALFRFSIRLAILYSFWIVITFLPDYVRLSPDMSFLRWLATDATKHRANYLWFFPSLAFGITTCSLIIRMAGKKAICLFAFLCFIVFYIVENCSGLFQETVLPELSRMAYSKFYYGRIWIAFPYLCLGIHFANIKDVSCYNSTSMILLAYFSLCAERWIIMDVLHAPSENAQPELWLFSVVFCFFTMNFLLHCNRETSVLTRFLRSASVVIYVTHGILLSWFTRLQISSNAILYFVIVMSGIGITSLLLCLEKNKIFKWVSWLH